MSREEEPMTKTIEVEKKDVSRAEKSSPERVERTDDRPRFLPRTDIYEEPNGLALLVDMPGVEERNLEVHLENGVLTLLGRVEAEDFGKRALRLEEYAVGDYYRSFSLSEEVDVKGITAELHNGVLRVFLPKAEKARPRKIPVKAG
jgi:HSP20 family molecular chaperone IbpA